MSSDSYKKILTAANIVTITRILLVPVFVVAILAPWPSWVPDTATRDFLEAAKPWIAAAIFALLALTDNLDGYLARSRNEVTTFGKFLDPIADKILVAAALLALIELHELPAWVVLIIITREFLVSGLRMVVSAEGHVIDASPLGKNKTVAQVIAITLFIIKSNSTLAVALGDLYTLFNYICWAVMIVALFLTVYSLADYFYKASKVLGLPMKKGEPSAEGIDNSTPAGEVIREAIVHKMNIATAESCTGGLIAKCLTDVAGASEVFHGGVVSYTNEVKEHELGVSKETLDSFGAVSQQTAVEMAQGVLKALEADIAISTTGVAGPTGGSKEKPVGTVWIGIACKEPGNYNRIITSAKKFTFGGNRQEIRTQAANEALLALQSQLSSLRQDSRVCKELPTIRESIQGSSEPQT